MHRPHQNRGVPKIGDTPLFHKPERKNQKDSVFLHKFVFSIFAPDSRSLLLPKFVVTEEF